MCKRPVVVLAVTAVVGGLVSPAALADDASADPVVLGVHVNGGQDVVIGTTRAKTFDVTVVGSDDSGLYFADVDLKGPNSGFYTTDGFCETDFACTSSFTVTPGVDPYNDDMDLSNANAGTWYVSSIVDAWDGGEVFKERIGTFRVKRAAKVTVNAAPEPVTKGGTITVTGKLTRANWDTYRYAGYTDQPVKLQFRPKGSDTYTTVRTVGTNGTGNLKTTVKAASDGYWRWSFAGTTTTAPKSATGDYVDVR